MNNDKIIAKFYTSIIIGVLTFGICQNYMTDEIYYLNGSEICKEDYDKYKNAYEHLYNDIVKQAGDGIYLYKDIMPDYKLSIFYSVLAYVGSGLLLIIPTAFKNTKTSI